MSKFCRFCHLFVREPCSDLRDEFASAALGACPNPGEGQLRAALARIGHPSQALPSEHHATPGRDPLTQELVDNPLVIYHAPCPDGFAAALCAWRHFSGKGEYVPIAHDREPPDVTGRVVYMLDIAFEPHVMERVERTAARLVVLDHHQSAADKLKGFSCRCGLALFDLTKSAARLSWEFFNPGEPAPALIQHVEDRDLLAWMLEDSEAYLLALDAGPYNFLRWAGVLTMPLDAFDRFLEKGRAMHTQFTKLATDMASHARPLVLNGQPGLVANAPFVFHTAVGALLSARSGTFAAVWSLEDAPEGQRVRVGLRAVEGYNLIPLAEAFGGGGHPNAAAFRLKLARLPELIAGDLRPKA